VSENVTFTHCVGPSSQTSSLVPANSYKRACSANSVVPASSLVCELVEE